MIPTMSATNPRRNRPSEPRMLVAVAAGSPRTNSFWRTNTENPAGTALITFSPAASLALARGVVFIASPERSAWAAPG